MESFPFDRAGKWLIVHHGDAVLRLAGVTDIPAWQAVQTEVVQPRQLPDGLIEVERPGAGRPDLFVVEIATDPEARIAEQVFADLALVYLDRGVLPEAVVLVLRPKGRLRAPGRFDERGRHGWSRLQAKWRVVNLWRMPAADLLSADEPGLAPWATVARWDGPPEALFRRCRELIDRKAPPAEHANMLAVAVRLADIRYHNHPELLAILGGKQAVIDSPLMREIMDEQAAQLLHETIPDVLAERFGAVPPDLVAAVRSIQDVGRLKTVIRLAARAKSYATFRRDLAALTAAPPDAPPRPA
jgi:hypothetical protein